MHEKILIVDDEEEILRLLRIELSMESYEIITATCGKEAIEKAHGLHPKLILMDVMLPDMSGAEVVRKLKLNPMTQRIPIVFLTALFSKFEEEQQEHIKVDDHNYEAIAKPIDHEMLLEKVRKALASPG